LWSQSKAAFNRVEDQTGKRFGDPVNPLLVSVRSGSGQKSFMVASNP